VQRIFDALLEQLDYREKSRGADYQRYKYLDETHRAPAAGYIYFNPKVFKRQHHGSRQRRKTRGAVYLKLSLLYIILPNFQVKLKRNEKMCVFLSAGRVPTLYKLYESMI
jgi:hypothetical protein